MAPLLEMHGIGKAFHGVKALADVNLAVRAGEIHAVVGENGAGKSTLMKVLSGVFPHGSYEGRIVFDGEERRFGGIADSERLGIIIIHQELALVPLLSVAENIFLGNERARHGVIDEFASYAATKALLARVRLAASPLARVTDLGIGQQQLVEIAKALSKQVRLLILDEPTASLNETDSDALLLLLSELRAQGVACILITHKLNEVAKIADAITVIRDGSTIATLDCRDRPVPEAEVIRLMVGREMAERYPHRRPQPGALALEVKDWCVHHAVHRERLVVDHVSLHARHGEIVGIAGLMGAGRTELAMSLFGHSYGHAISGEVRIDGRPVDTSSVDRAIALGLAYVTEDRKGLGLVLDDAVAHNVSLANLGGVSRSGVIDGTREAAVAEDYRRRLNIRCAGITQPVVNLSGGNQQKVVLAKWLFAEPQVLILDEPTRGIDVGAKFEIYSLMAELAAAGKCIVMISSEMPELLGMCDRLYVMNEGRFIAEMDAAGATQEKIMHAIVADGHR